jgi:hypothetical protein
MEELCELFGNQLHLLWHRLYDDLRISRVVVQIYCLETLGGSFPRIPHFFGYIVA